MKSLSFVKFAFSSFFALALPLLVLGDTSEGMHDAVAIETDVDEEDFAIVYNGKQPLSTNGDSDHHAKLDNGPKGRHAPSEQRAGKSQNVETNGIQTVDAGSIASGVSNKNPFAAGLGASFEATVIDIVSKEGGIPQMPPKKPSARLSRKKNQGRARKLAKGSKAVKSAKSSKSQNKITKDGCIQGDASFVTETCMSYNCCSGVEACKWRDDQIATVCPSSCNGYQACYYVGDGTRVDSNSCNGYKACRLLARKSLSATSEIGKNACNGKNACFQMCAQSEDCEVSVGTDACDGYEDCKSIGQDSEDIKVVSIGDESCVSRASTVSDGRACAMLGAASSQEINVGKSSCQGFFACVDLGYFSARSVEVGDFSCSGRQSCSGLGLQSAEHVEVGDGSCNDKQACSFLGRRSRIEPVSVGDKACTGYKSCYFFGYKVTDAAITVEDEQCSMANECSGGAIGACQYTATVPNDDGMCPLS